MLAINLIRTLAILFAVGLYQIYNHDFLTWDQGLVIFALSFIGLTLTEIVEGYMIDSFNQDPENRRP